MKPLAIDLFCGLGGWTEGLLANGYYVIGFDIERHVYGEHKYPGQLGGAVCTVVSAEYLDCHSISGLLKPSYDVTLRDGSLWVCETQLLIPIATPEMTVEREQGVSA